MDYPLGSFPRFGHQERWARERRERAIENSITTRRWNAYWRRQRKAPGMSLIDDCQRFAAAEDAQATLFHLGHVGLDWANYMLREEYRIKVDAEVAPALTAEIYAIHAEFEALAAAFGQLPDAQTDPASRIYAIRRMDARFGSLGPRIEAFKQRMSAARIGPLRLMWRRFRAWLSRESPSNGTGVSSNDAENGPRPPGHPPTLE